MVHKKVLFVLVLLTLIFSLSINAECPNGCSNAGTCGPKDKCTCFKNRQGNDCSEYTCPFEYAHADSPKGDLDMDGDVDTNTVITGSQVYPMGTREKFPDAVNHEGHFYAECANKGLCDRSTGDCECFDGYTGSACQRTVCPADCNGHGTCESIQELASDASGTLYGDWMEAGDVSYTLWDKKATYGCKCDPWFYGPDCSKRRCKVGVDPMYSCGTPVYDTQVIRLVADSDTDTGTITGTFRLRFFDHWGESYITESISFDATQAASDATDVSTALLNLPNDVISAVKCESLSHLSDLDGKVGDKIGKYTNNAGISVACQFLDNPGRLRTMEFVEPSILNDNAAASTGHISISTSRLRGENTDWAAQKSTATATVTQGSTSITLDAADTTYINTVSPPDGITVSTYRLGKLLDQYFLLTNVATTTWTTYSKWGGATISTGVNIYLSSATIAADTAKITDWNVGEKTATTDTAAGVSRGDWIFVENQLFVVQGVSGTTLTLDRAFNGVSDTSTTNLATATIDIFIVTPSATTNNYEYVSECSGRGLCDADTGICSCFKGYTKDNCNQQNILAF